MRRFALLSVLLLGLTVPSRAEAVTLGLDLGGGYWFDGAAQFDFHFKVQFALGKVVSFGIRPGIMMNIYPGVEIGLPADVYFRFHVSRLYFDILGGLAILFGNAQPFRAHAGVGMGVFIAKGFAIGFEGGYLMNSANVLLRLQFNF